MNMAARRLLLLIRHSLTHTHERGGGTDRPGPPRSPRPPLSGLFPHGIDLSLHTNLVCSNPHTTPSIQHQIWAELHPYKTVPAKSILKRSPLLLFRVRFAKDNRSHSGTRCEAATSHCATSVSQSRKALAEKVRFYMTNTSTRARKSVLPIKIPPFLFFSYVLAIFLRLSDGSILR